MSIRKFELKDGSIAIIHKKGMASGHSAGIIVKDGRVTHFLGSLSAGFTAAFGVATSALTGGRAAAEVLSAAANETEQAEKITLDGVSYNAKPIPNPPTPEKLKEQCPSFAFVPELVAAAVAYCEGEEIGGFKDRFGFTRRAPRDRA